MLESWADFQSKILYCENTYICDLSNTSISGWNFFVLQLRRLNRSRGDNFQSFSEWLNLYFQKGLIPFWNTLFLATNKNFNKSNFLHDSMTPWLDIMKSKKNSIFIGKYGFYRNFLCNKKHVTLVWYNIVSFW